MEINPWIAYLFFAFVGLFVLVLGGIMVLAIGDAIRIAYKKHPSRFQRVDRLDAFEREKLPELAQRLDMEVVDKVPSKFAEVVETLVGRIGVGGVSDMLSRSYNGGDTQPVQCSEKTLEIQTLAGRQSVGMDQNRRIYLSHFHGRGGDGVSEL